MNTNRVPPYIVINDAMGSFVLVSEIAGITSINNGSSIAFKDGREPWFSIKEPRELLNRMKANF